MDKTFDTTVTVLFILTLNSALVPHFQFLLSVDKLQQHCKSSQGGSWRFWHQGFWVLDFL